MSYHMIYIRRYLYHANIHLRPISALWPSTFGLILEFQVDIGCDTDFVMHYFLLDYYMALTALSLIYSDLGQYEMRY